MAFFVAKGKTVTTARGAVTGGVGNDPLTPGCLVKDKTDKALLKEAGARLKVLAAKGVLIEADQHPDAEAAEAAAEAASAEAAAAVAAAKATAEAFAALTGAQRDALTALTDEEADALTALTDEDRATLVAMVAEDAAAATKGQSKGGKGKGGAQRGD